MQMILKTSPAALKMGRVPLPKKIGPLEMGRLQKLMKKLRPLRRLSSARLPPLRAVKRLQKVSTRLAELLSPLVRKMLSLLTDPSGPLTLNLALGLNRKSRTVIVQKMARLIAPPLTNLGMDLAPAVVREVNPLRPRVRYPVRGKYPKRRPP